MKLYYKIALIATCLIASLNVSSQNFHLDNILKTRPGLRMNVPVKSTKNLYSYSKEFNFIVKNKENDWTILYISPENLTALLEGKLISECQINFEPGQVLNDTARIMAKVDSVYLGAAPLATSYKGAGTIVGVIDTGIDFNHPDLQNADGSTRVLHYWDQTLVDTNALFNPAHSSMHGYGQVWDSTDINSGNCLSMDTHLHGTHVTGTAAGNALGNGQNMGMAPEANIIMVESDFSHPNWSISVAEACDYIFHVADSLNMPASINISLGSYLGSHDGDDIATEMMEAMLDEKPGRLITVAVGNSGVWGDYHCGADVTADTSFVWFKTNMSSAFGGPACYFDLWADTLDFDGVSFAFGADEPASFDHRGTSPFYNIQDILGANYTDSIMTLAGDKIGTFELQTSLDGDRYHLEFLMQNPDSSAYNFSFKTTGAGHYDLWADDYFGISQLISTGLPTAAQMPDIVHYNMPDSLQTIISGWASSEKIIAVGYSRGQLTYLDVNDIEQSKNDVPPGHLSLRSSKGPSRKGVTKPDVVAAGASILSCGPLDVLATFNTTLVAQGGLHLRYSGSSMSSPLVAGIGALYFEKCPKASWSDFKRDLTENAVSDAVTGATPNHAWGFGRANAFRTLIGAKMEHTFTEDTILCETPIALTLPISDSVLWMNDDETNPLSVNTPDDYSAEYYIAGCKGTTDTISIIQGTVPDYPAITFDNDILSAASGPNFQWYFEGVLIEGATSSTYIPTETGDYAVIAIDPSGCEKPSLPFTVDALAINEETLDNIGLYPNPTNGNVTVQVDQNKFDYLQIIDINGKIIQKHSLIGLSKTELNLSSLASGVYTIQFSGSQNIASRKLLKNK